MSRFRKITAKNRHARSWYGRVFNAELSPHAGQGWDSHRRGSEKSSGFTGEISGHSGIILPDMWQSRLDACRKDRSAGHSWWWNGVATRWGSRISANNASFSLWLHKIYKCGNAWDIGTKCLKDWLGYGRAFKSCTNYWWRSVYSDATRWRRWHGY